MSATSEKSSKVYDSQVTFGKDKYKKDIIDLAETKFGSALIKVSVNRKEECFDVFVEDSVTDAAANEFEDKWSMCKVHKFKAVPRKKS